MNEQPSGSSAANNEKSTYIGIDLGTSSVKLLLVEEDGKILASATRSYQVFYPHSGWSEQNPSDWFSAVTDGLKNLLDAFDKKSVKGISFGGQMHGLVMLDKDDEVIRPAILWNDGRTEKQTEYLNTVIGKQFLSDHTANIAYAGFTAPKILWVKENERENFERIDKIMLPKDYLIYRLSGSFATDYSDASGMLLLDVQKRTWSKEMCQLCSVKEEWLPKLYESYEVVGSLKKEIAEQLGLSSEVKIIAGGGDNAAAAIGTGTVTDGACNISLGTSGTVFISSDDFKLPENNSLHSFCHANGKYHLMGCMLSAASCNKWWVEDILNSDYGELNGFEEYLGNNDVYYMPYLMGERSPHNDVDARAAFIGMRANTPRGKMTLAVLEGVTFGLRDCVEAAKKSGIAIERTKICGGGAKSKLWQKIVANVLGIPVDVPLTEEGPSFGGAILAMVGCGAYKDVLAATNKCVGIKETIYPEEKLVALYDEKYKIFDKLYPALKCIFKEIK